MQAVADTLQQTTKNTLLEVLLSSKLLSVL